MGEGGGVDPLALGAGVLGQVAEAALDVGDARRRFGAASEHLQEAGLARPVPPDQPDLVAGAHGERGRLEGEAPADLDREVPYGQHPPMMAPRWVPPRPCSARRRSGPRARGSGGAASPRPARRCGSRRGTGRPAAARWAAGTTGQERGSRNRRLDQSCVHLLAAPATLNEPPRMRLAVVPAQTATLVAPMREKIAPCPRSW